MPIDQTTHVNKTSASMYSVVLLPTQDHHFTNVSYTFFFSLKDFFTTKLATGLSHSAGDLQHSHFFTV